MPQVDEEDREEKETKIVDDNEPEPILKQFKVIILGDGTVGKTSFSLRVTEDKFINQYKQTIGVDFFLRKLILPGGVIVALQMWDIGGQSIGAKMIRKYIYGAHAVLFIYDVTNYESFQNLEDWYRVVRQSFGDNPMPYMALVANKNDLSHLRVVSTEEHNNFADENNMCGFQISAKSGYQVEKTIFQVAADLAGVTLTKSDMVANSHVIPAQIVNYQRHDNKVEGGHLPDFRKKKTYGCIVA